MKKFISVMLAALMLASTMSATVISASAEEVVEPVYVVAGSEALCGVNWVGDPTQATDNVMTFSDDVYTKVFTDVQPAEDLQLKVVENLADGTQNWIGDATGNNVTFNVDTACDVTVTMTTDKVISVTGDGVSFKSELKIDSMCAVGGGDGAWLNGVVWDPASELNIMTEVADKVYEITYEGVEGPFSDYQAKFAANGGWADNWGGTYVESGEAFDAVYNATDNIIVDVPYEVANVTLTLDLSAFDYATKTGAKATITVVDMTESEPVEDTTASEEVTDPVEDTTASEEVTDPVEDTTASEEVTDPVEDTTASEEVTDPVEDTTAPAAAPVYVVAGVEALCGVNWNGNPAEATDNVMVEADGVYTKVFTDVAVADNYSLKVVENLADGTQNWIGDSTGNNVVFNVVKEACDVTVTYNPATGEITVSGDNVTFVTDIEINAMCAVGGGDGAWLNGVVWDPASELNMMTEVAERVYEITFTGVEGPFSDYQVKFAANGEWTHNWGGTYVASGEAFDAVYNANDNIIVDVPYELADVTLTLDLSAFDYATKTGAKITITVVDATEVEVLVGDVDGNNELDVDDVTYLQMSLAGYEGYEVATEVADVTGDGVVDVEDVTAIQFILAGIEI